MSKRIAFTFDERSVAALQKITDDGGFASMADAVRESLQIMRALQIQQRCGFTELIVRDSAENERHIVIPSLSAEKVTTK